MQGHVAGSHDDPGMLPVSITVSILAVLLALVSLLGHRAHTKTFFAQNLTIAQWVYYESKATGRTSYDALLDFLSAASLKDDASASRLKDRYEQKMAQSDREQKQLGAKATALEMEVEHDEAAADRFDFGDVCLEAALVITSVTMLTKRRIYWWVGCGVACIGLAVATTGFFVH